MQFSILGALVFGVLASAASVPFSTPRGLVDDLNDEAIAALVNKQANGLVERSCTLSNASVRKDWEKLTPDERKDYSRAVNCLMALPSKSDPTLVPGARSRYDDFVAQHINQTLTIHRTGNFLSWHRYFIGTYEKALQNECDYKGTQPYWNWFTYQSDPSVSPVFDGSDTSMSGDGSFVQHNGSVAGAGSIFLPSGNGGGCITSGPFKNMTVNLGPISPTMDGQQKINGSSLDYNPRCLKRDLSAFTAYSWLSENSLLNITKGEASKDILSFQNELQGRFSDGALGLHAAGHFVIGGDAGDLYSSPVDPAFWLHHAMVDRVHWIWQALYPDQAITIAGTVTILNNPPSRNATLDDLVDMGVNAPVRPIRDLLDTLGSSPFCYMYE